MCSRSLKDVALLVRRKSVSAIGRRSMSQLASTVLMVRPASFGYNESAAVDNEFMEKEVVGIDSKKKAKEEFDNFISTLKREDICVKVLEDSSSSPDACFPNNWISFHAIEKKIIVYPMKVPVRREEKRGLSNVLSLLNLTSKCSVWDMSHYAEKGQYLEGTGSMVLDRVNKIAYACSSQRTHSQPLQEFCDVMSYRKVVFQATMDSMPIYHTNVMLSVGERLAVVCTEAIGDPQQRTLVKSTLEETGKTIVEISKDQVKNFAGNVIEVRSRGNESVMVMSSRAHDSFSAEQRRTIGSFCRLLHVPLPVIERLGGGSARCMIAEVFH